MAHQTIYKHIRISNETTWGASVSGTSIILPITSQTIQLNPNKALVEDTQVSVKGRDRMTIGRNEIEGDIQAYASPRTLHHMLQWAMGTSATTSAVGSSATLYTYGQNTDNNFLSRGVQIDRNNSQEKFSGVRASQLEMTASDGYVEMTLGVMGKTRGTGVSLADVAGEMIKPFEFADVTIQIGGVSLSNATTVQASNWSFTYNNGLQSSHLSGSRDPSRLDGGIATLEGTIEIFHEGTSFVSPTYGCSELYIRFEASTVSCHGLIAGVTPYYMRVDIPRVQFTSDERPYEQAELSKETINFTALYDQSMAALIRPQLTSTNDPDA